MMNTSNSSSLISWPPPFKIRRSLKARRIHLTIKRNKEIELVLPQKVSEKAGIEFFNTKRPWIEKNLAKISERNLPSDKVAIELPKIIHLPAILHTVLVDYIKINTKKRIITLETDNKLCLSGNADDFSLCIETLNSWLKNMAQRHLTPKLIQLSHELKLPFKQVNFRSQKTLWGSCSPKKDIHLNYKLLFLSQDLVRYVMIHELCHTVHLNHSKRFWQLVAKFEPQYLAHRKSLIKADEFLPLWSKN